jgi:hypothetical protein
MPQVDSGTSFQSPVLSYHAENRLERDDHFF